jgi:hypothetical protein
MHRVIGDLLKFNNLARPLKTLYEVFSRVFSSMSHCIRGFLNTTA